MIMQSRLWMRRSLCITALLIQMLDRRSAVFVLPFRFELQPTRSCLLFQRIDQKDLFPWVLIWSQVSYLACCRSLGVCGTKGLNISGNIGIQTKSWNVNLSAISRILDVYIIFWVEPLMFYFEKNISHRLSERAHTESNLEKLHSVRVLVSEQINSGTLKL